MEQTHTVPHALTTRTVSYVYTVVFYKQNEKMSAVSTTDIPQQYQGVRLLCNVRTATTNGSSS